MEYIGPKWNVFTYMWLAVFASAVEGSLRRGLAIYRTRVRGFIVMHRCAYGVQGIGLLRAVLCSMGGFTIDTSP